MKTFKNITGLWCPVCKKIKRQIDIQFETDLVITCLECGQILAVVKGNLDIEDLCPECQSENREGNICNSCGFKKIAKY